MYSIYIAVLTTVVRANEEESFEEFSLRDGSIKQFSRLHTGDIGISDTDFWADSVSSRSRQRRAIFDTDTRFHISADGKFMSQFPFDTVVRLNMGCSGILVSKKHVLTAAHCLHDGRQYHQDLETGKLRIGTLKPKKSKKTRKRKDTRRKVSRKKNSRKSKRSDIADVTARQRRDIEQSENILDVFTPYRRKDRASRRKDKSARREKRQEKKDRKNKVTRDRARKLKEKKSFKWIKADNIKIPNSWKKNSTDTRSIQNIEHDYAVIELAEEAGTDYMRVTVSPEISEANSIRVHFSGFDEKAADELAYRFCMINKQTKDLIFHQCDAQPGSSGAGMYVRYLVPELKQWHRKIIGVFSGSNKDLTNGVNDYNIGMRITPQKYLNICFWIHGDADKCQKFRDEQLHRRPYVRNPRLGN